MIKFDLKGNLKPYQPIACSLADMKKHFVDDFVSTTRQANYDKYVKYSSDLKALLEVPELKQWVNGSFVTRKLNPKDIDLITFIDHATIERLGNKLDNFKPAKSWDVYGVDAYILEVHDQGANYIYTQSDMGYWQDQFGHTRVKRNGEKHKKGFLEINH